MPRPIKCKKVCCMPKCKKFVALDKVCDEKVVMTIEEYETIRLIDYQGFTQEQASVKMNIARTTVQGIYEQARKKLSIMLVSGSSLVIFGGSYTLCAGDESHCDCGGCERHKKFIEGEKKL